MEDPGGIEPLGARIKSPLPNRLRLERSGSIGDGDTAASRPGLVIVVVMFVSFCWFSRTVTIRGLPVISAIELREKLLVPRRGLEPRVSCMSGKCFSR
jgi:hypothetical protein